MQMLEQEVVDAKQQVLEACAAKGVELRSLAEFFKACLPLTARCIQESASVVDQVQDMLRRLSHQQPTYQGMPSRCLAFQSIRIVSVQSNHNPDVWNKYTAAKEAMKRSHKARRVHVKALDPAASFSGFDCLLPGLSLDKEVNELVLVHGCPESAAKSICDEGFDIRCASSHGGSLYGEGLYFTKEPCKADQYTDKKSSRYMIISRVALRDPKYLTSEYANRRPPCRDETSPCRGRFDSNVVDPKCSSRAQAHWEYILFDSCHAYPEMLIEYNVP